MKKSLLNVEKDGYIYMGSCSGLDLINQGKTVENAIENIEIILSLSADYKKIVNSAKNEVFEFELFANDLLEYEKEYGFLVKIKKEGERYIASCLTLEFVTQGCTVKKALDQMIDMAKFFFKEEEDMQEYEETLDTILIGIEECIED